MPEVKSFVLNDEKVINSYGFRVLNAGIKLERFRANPVILANHFNSVWTVIGYWTNIRVEGSQLLADPVFDVADPDSAVIAGKVERGFLKGASIGFGPAEGDEYFNFQKAEDGVPDLLSSELMEASIVAIPANRNAIAVKLYAADHTLLTEDAIKLSLNSIENLLIPNMHKLTLSVAALYALGLESTENISLVSEKVEKLAADHKTNLEKLKTAEEENKTLSAKLLKLEGDKAVELVDEAINKKMLGADQREAFIKLAQTDFASAKSLIEGMKPRNSLSGAVNNSAPVTGVKTMEEFEKLSVEQQLTFKAEHPEEYEQLFK